MNVVDIKIKKKGAKTKKNKEYSRSTDIRNAAELYDNLSISDKALIDAMMNTCFALLQNIQRLQNNSGKQTKETA